MIKVRLNSFENLPTDPRLQIADGMTLADAVSQALAGVPLEGRHAHELFYVVLNGQHYSNDLWLATKLKSTDEVFIYPWIQGDTEKGLFKTFVVLAVTLVTSVFLTPVVGGIAAGLLAGAASIGTTLLLNALIPPSNASSSATSAGDNGYADSQMYAISSQSNTTRKFNTVPKVYGRHRVFPTVAANPYTELEASANGAVSQYFYAIYDFGLGPVQISDIRIGDSPITNFSDVNYNLVDLNKPATDEGVWDINALSSFQLYKGSANSDSTSVTLDGNEVDGGDPVNYQVLRDASPNTLGTQQQIILSFVNTKGLYTYHVDGVIHDRNIELRLEFARVGTDDWHGYNDFNYVSSFNATGATSGINYGYFPRPVFDNPQANSLLSIFEWQAVSGYTRWKEDGISDFQPSVNVGPNQSVIKFTVGIKAGSTQILVEADSGNYVGVSFFDNFNRFIGRVAKVEFGVFGGQQLITFEEPTKVNVVFGAAEALFNGRTDADVKFSNIVRYANVWTLNELHYNYVDYSRLGFGDINLSNGFIGATIGQLRSGNTISGVGYLNATSQDAYYSTFKFTPRVNGSYKVRITRRASFSVFTYRIQDSLTFAGITTRADNNPIQTKFRHTFLEIRIRATNQLNGAVANLSAIATSAILVYDGIKWSRQLTSNPAWVFADLMTGEVNKRAIDISRLNTASLLDWAAFCDQVPVAPPSHTYTYPRFQCNFVLDYQATLQSVLGQVSNAAQASLNIVDGKYGVLVDRKKSTPVQIFTPRNSHGFSSSRVYTRRPDALNITYIDPFSDWESRQTTVYDQGFDVSTANDFDELTSFACTNDEQAWRYGRYMLAQNRLRQETITINTDFEYLVCTRGDYVQVVQEVMRVGGTPARVKSVTSQTVLIDEGLNIDPTLTYGYVFRSSATGSISQGSVSNAIASDTFLLLGPIPNVGDLIVIGESGNVVYDCLVKTIAPSENLTAQLTLVEKADDIYDAESTDTFPEYSPKISKTYDPDLAPPPAITSFVVLDNSYRCNGLAYQYYIDLDWDVPDNSAPEKFEVYADSGKGFNLVGTTRDSAFEYIVDASALGALHTFKVLAVSASGKKIDLGAAPFVTATPLYKTAKPPDVASLSIDITNEVLQLVWPKLDDCDIQQYSIRYSPTMGGTWEYSIPLLRVDRQNNLASTQARTGQYLIKAVDFNGNESVNAAIAITTIPNLINLNVVETVNDAPTFAGSVDRTEVIGTSLVLQDMINAGTGLAQYYTEGYYYYQGLVDLSEIYTVRLQSLIQAQGITAGDLMVNWTPLASVVQLSGAMSSDWDVETQYRSTNNFNVMSEWVTLASVDVINAGQADAYTPWRKFIIGDATGRVFQFRLKLTSNRASVTPRVLDGTIRLDMPDRLESYNNLQAPTDGYTIAYDPRFKGPDPSPNVQVTVDNAQSGDYWSFDYKTLAGLKIRFFDKNNNPVARQFDLAVKGFGRKNANVI